MQMNKNIIDNLVKHFETLTEMFQRKERNIESIKSELDNELIHFRQETNEIIEKLNSDKQLKGEFYENYNSSKNSPDNIDVMLVLNEVKKFDKIIDKNYFSDFIIDYAEENRKLKNVILN